MIRFVIVASVIASGVAMAAITMFGSNETVSYEMPTQKGLVDIPALEWATEGPALPRTFTTYQAADKVVTPVAAVQIANALGILAPQVEFDLEQRAYHVLDTSSPYHVVVHAQGKYIVYRNPDTVFDTVERQPVLPTEDEALRLALARLDSADLLPPAGEYADDAVHFYRNEQIELNVETNERVGYFTNLQVRFTRFVNGLPAVGPGAVLYVHFADNSEIAGITKKWQPLEVFTEVSVIDIEELRRRASSGEGTYSVDGPCDRAIITDAQLKYLINHQGVAFPVAALEGTCQPSGGELTAFISLVAT